MFRLFRHALSFSLTALLLMYSGQAQAFSTMLDLTEAEKEYLQIRKKLTIVCDPYWPPYEYINDEGFYEGMTIEYQDILAKRIGVPFERIITTSWPESLEMAKKGQCDLVSSVNATPKRREYLDFTEPFMVSPLVVIGIGAPGTSTLDDYSGQTFAVVKSYRIEEDLNRDHPSIEHHLVANTEESLKAVAAGKAIGTVATHIEADHFIRVNNLKGLNPVGTTEYINKHGMGVRKGDKLLLSIMQKAVRSLTQEDVEAIEQKWISSYTKQPSKASSKLTLPTIIAILMLIGSIWFAIGRSKTRH